MKKLFLKCSLWLCVIACMTAIFIFSAQNADTSSQTSASVTAAIASFIVPKYSALPELQQVDIVISLNSIIRSCAHFSIFGLLGVLVALAFLPYKLSSHMRNVIAAAFCLFYAFSDEIHQLFVPGRAFQLFDILVDFCGSLCGIAFIYIIYIIKKKVQSKGSI